MYSFKAYRAVDFQMSYHIFLFLKERFLEHLKDTASFHNPYDNLSKHVNIKKSSDNLMKTYSWHERDTGCCPSYENHNISKIESEYESFYITELQIIKTKKNLLSYAWVGTCYGSKHYNQARIYEIKMGDYKKMEAILIVKKGYTLGLVEEVE